LGSSAVGFLPLGFAKTRPAFRLLLPSLLSTRIFGKVSNLMPQQPAPPTTTAPSQLLPALSHAVAHALRHAQAQRVVLGLSGGLDSMLLLELLYRLELKLPLQAVYVHHGLSPNADCWGQFCQAQCQQRGIAFSIAQVTIADPTRNIEAQARSLRYQALSAHIKAPSDVLLTAHHADDQLETLLLALKRGSGLDGMTGIAAVKDFGTGRLLRPLLGFSRQELALVAQSIGLDWIEDESNGNQDFDRNFLRQQVLPLLNQRFARFSQNASRSAQLLQQNQQWQQQQLASSLAEMVVGDRLDLAKLKQQDMLTQGLLLRAFAKQQHLILSQQQLEILQSEVIAAKPDATAKLQLDQLVFRRYQHCLFLQPVGLESPVMTTVELRWRELRQTASHWYYWADEAPQLLGDDTGKHSCLPLSVEREATLTVQSVAMSALFKPSDRPTKPLKQWCQLWNIPPWQRQALPVVTAQGQVIAVAGYASACSTQDAKSWLWQGPLTQALNDRKD
jgi:tRNA(Ile)-lysidine synthase